MWIRFNRPLFNFLLFFDEFREFNSMGFHIAIIGAGQVGSRHLQALKRLDRDISISVVDKNAHSLKLSQKCFEEVDFNEHVQSVSYLETINSLHHDIDIAVVATNADVRRQVIEQLLQQILVRFFILEKVVFQSVADFESIIDLLDDKKIKAWVNCPRRMYPFYQQIKKNFYVDKRIFINLFGGGWGLACNSIHFLDLLSFLTEHNRITLDGSGLDKSIQQSKRKGYKEFTGILKGATDNGSAISLLDYKGTIAPSVIHIHGKNSSFIIFENQGKALMAQCDTDYAWKEVPFPKPYQSQLTNLVVQQVLDTGECALTPLEESFCIHKPMLETFNAHLEKVTGERNEMCPIT